MKELFYRYQRCVPIPGHLIVPDSFCPGRETHTRDSGIPGIPGQLVTLPQKSSIHGTVASRVIAHTLLSWGSSSSTVLAVV